MKVITTFLLFITLLITGCSAPVLPSVTEVHTMRMRGTGFVIADGLVVTAAHVIGDAAENEVMIEYTTTWTDGHFVTFGLVRSADFYRDIAVIDARTTGDRGGIPVCPHDIRYGDELIIYSARNSTRRRMKTVVVTETLHDKVYALGYKARQGDSGSPVLLAGQGCAAGIVIANNDKLGLVIARLKGIRL